MAIYPECFSRIVLHASCMITPREQVNAIIDIGRGRELHRRTWPLALADVLRASRLTSDERQYRFHNMATLISSTLCLHVMRQIRLCNRSVQRCSPCTKTCSNLHRTTRDRATLWQPPFDNAGTTVSLDSRNAQGHPVACTGQRTTSIFAVRRERELTGRTGNDRMAVMRPTYFLFQFQSSSAFRANRAH